LLEDVIGNEQIATLRRLDGVDVSRICGYVARVQLASANNQADAQSALDHDHGILQGHILNEHVLPI
jgi:hypothetical protein